LFTLVQRFNEGMLRIGEGEPTRGMDQLMSIKLRSAELGFVGELFIGINEAVCTPESRPEKPRVRSA